MALFSERHYEILASWAKEQLEFEEHAKAIGGHRPMSAVIWSLATALGYDNKEFDLNNFIEKSGLKPLGKTEMLDYTEIIQNVRRLAGLQ